MRVLTRITATLLTAGALIAPATMPAAHAATPTAVVTHSPITPTDTRGEFTFTPSDVAGPQALQGGQQLVIRNQMGAARTYQLRATHLVAGPSTTFVTIPALPGIATIDVPLGQPNAVNPDSRYVLTVVEDTPTPLSYAFVAL